LTSNLDRRADKLGIKKRTFADPEKQRVHDVARATLASGPQAFVDRYRQEFGSVFNADNAAELFHDYRQSDESRALHHATIHDAARWVRDEAFRQALANPETKRVVFTAGGSAAGKSTAIAGVEGDGTIIYDTTLSQFGGSRHAIDRALAAGKEGGVIYLDRDPVEAFRANLDRAVTTGRGRTTSVSSMARTHAGAAETIGKLVEHYGPGGNVEFRFYRNEAGKISPTTIDAVRQRDYTGIEGKLQDVLEQYRGKLPEYVFRAAGGKLDGPDSGTGGTLPPEIRGPSGPPDQGAP